MDRVPDMTGKESEFNKLLRNREVTVEQLRAFVLVLEEGSFTAAARLLNRTQSTVTQSIHKLESELGIRLINRKQGAKLSFTPAAVSFGHEVSALIFDIDNAIHRFKSSSKIETLVIGIPDSVKIDTLSWLSQQIQLCSRYDKVSFLADSSKALEEALHENRVDGIITCEILYRRPEQATGPVFNYQWVANSHTHINDMESLPVVAQHDGILRDIIESSLDSMDKNYYFSFISRSTSSNLAAIQAGLGVGIAKANTASEQALCVLNDTHGFPALPSLQLKFKASEHMDNQQLIKTIEEAIMKLH